MWVQPQGQQLQQFIGAVLGVVVASGGAGIAAVARGGAGCTVDSAVGDASAVGAAPPCEGDVPSSCVSATSLGGI